MNATAHFYDSDTNVVLQTPNSKGGSTYTLFEKVSIMIYHARETGMEITNIITHHD